MKNLIVYYSVSGQTRYVADIIKEQLKCDVFEIKTKEEIKPGVFSRYYKGTKAMFSSVLPELKPYDINIDDYDRIIFGFPNWGSNFPPAVKAFIEQNDFSGKKIYLYTTYVARGGSKCLENAAKYFRSSSVEEIGKFSLPKSKDKEKLSEEIKGILDKLKF